MRAPLPIEPLPAGLSAFLLGILSAGIPSPNPQLFFWIAVFLLAAAAAASLLKRRAVSCLLIAGCVFFLGVSHTQRFQEIPLSDISRFTSRNPILIQGIVANNPAEEGGRALLRLEEMVEPVGVRPVGGNLLLTFKERPAPLRYGDRIRARVIVERPQATADFDYPAYLARQRIYAVARLGGADVAILGTAPPSRILSLAFRLRAKLRRNLELAVPAEPQATILEAMSFGLRQPRAEVKDYFRKVGTYHLLVVSGFNVGFFLIFLQLALSPFPLHPRLRSLCCLPAIFLFCLACGLSAPVVRAGLMAGFYYLGKALNRPSRPAFAISAAAFVLLLVNPLSLLDAGWQLTFGITLGLIVGADRLSGWFSALPRWAATGLSATIIGQLASVPLVAFHFGSVQLLGLLTNLVFVPFSAVIVFESFLAVLPAVGHLFGPTALFLSTVFYHSTRLVSSLPFSSVDVPPRNPWYFLGYLPLAALILAAGWKAKTNPALATPPRPEPIIVEPPRA